MNRSRGTWNFPESFIGVVFYINGTVPPRGAILCLHLVANEQRQFECHWCSFLNYAVNYGPLVCYEKRPSSGPDPWPWRVMVSNIAGDPCRLDLSIIEEPRTIF